MILENGLIRDEHYDWREYKHAIRIPQDQHDALRKRLAENGWTEVDNRSVMDAHEEWIKGEYKHQYRATFPGCWTRTKEGHNTIYFQLNIRFKTGYTDYTREEWDTKWKKRKEAGYVVVDGFEMKEPVVKWSEIKLPRFDILKASRERAKESIDEAHIKLLNWKETDIGPKNKWTKLQQNKPST